MEVIVCSHLATLHSHHHRRHHRSHYYHAHLCAVIVAHFAHPIKYHFKKIAQNGAWSGAKERYNDIVIADNSFRPIYNFLMIFNWPFGHSLLYTVLSCSDNFYAINHLLEIKSGFDICTHRFWLFSVVWKLDWKPTIMESVNHKWKKREREIERKKERKKAYTMKSM